MNDDGGLAFPCEQSLIPERREWNQTFSPGMSLRDCFALQAPINLDDACKICGFAIDVDITLDSNRAITLAVMAAVRYEYADAMLVARAALPKEE